MNETANFSYVMKSALIFRIAAVDSYSLRNVGEKNLGTEIER